MQVYLLLAYTENGTTYYLMAQKNITDLTPTYDNVICNSAGQWVIPGGKTKPNEAADVGAIREFKEETGYTVTSTTLLYNGSPKYKVFQTTLTSKPAINLPDATHKELHRVGWYTKTQALNILYRFPVPNPTDGNHSTLFLSTMLTPALKTQYLSVPDEPLLSIGMRPRHIRNERMAAPFDWYQNALVALP